MNSILIISNDSRAEVLVKAYQLQLKGQVNCVADFDRGLKEVFDKRPAAVFIQSEISGISGDAVAKHIKGLLRDSSPRLILLREAPEKPLGSRNTFDESIDLFLAEDDLHDQFKSQLEKVPSLQWLETAASATPPVTASAEEFPLVLEPETATIATEPVKASPSPAPSQPEADSSVSGPATTAPAARPARPTVQPAATPAAPPRPQVRVQPARVAPEIIPVPNVAAAETPPLSALNGRGGGSSATRRYWPYLLGLLVPLTVAVCWYYLPKTSTTGNTAKVTATPAPTAKPPVTVKSSVPVTPAAGLGTVLPSSIPVNGRDAAYAGTHPGWERYLGTDYEFLVFREQGTIRAFQVIARTGAGIPEPFIRTFLREVSVSDAYRVTSRQEQGGYLVEDGKSGIKDEILLYRKKSSGVIRAFVVTVS